MSGPAFAIDTSPVQEENFSVKDGFQNSINFKFMASVEDQSILPDELCGTENVSSGNVLP